MGGGGRRQRRADDVIHKMKVSLEDLYNGKVTKLSLSKNVLCGDCGGKGSKKADAVKKCDACRGAGIRVVIQQIGPGFVQQSQQRCDECGGQGEVIRQKDRCPRCRGAKTVSERKVIEVNIGPGACHGDKIVLHGEGDQAPDIEAGDVIILLEEKPHATFQRSERDEMDLFMKHTLTLSEALCGFTFQVVTLDGRILRISSRPGEVVKPGDIRGIAGEGMPRKNASYEKGRLFIKFDVAFPGTGELALPQKQLIETVFTRPPPPPAPPPGVTAEETTLQDLDPAQPNPRSSYAASATDDDDPRARGGMHGQPVACQTQ